MDIIYYLIDDDFICEFSTHDDDDVSSFISWLVMVCTSSEDHAEHVLFSYQPIYEDKVIELHFLSCMNVIVLFWYGLKLLDDLKLHFSEHENLRLCTLYCL